VNTKTIIDFCLKGLDEADVTDPQQMTRADVLTLINLFYQNNIGKRLKILAPYSYDGSDAAHTITNGVGTLPSDFLAPSYIYDGDAPDQEPLTRITRIEDKIANDDDTSQYMLPDKNTLWIFGQTPTNEIKLYYYKKPTALTDSESSEPVYLKEEFHLAPFEKLIKDALAFRRTELADALDLETWGLDILDAIESAHAAEMLNDGPESIEADW
jgi:hypothetical protein